LGVGGGAEVDGEGGAGAQGRVVLVDEQGSGDGRDGEVRRRRGTL
jgi:hypothetical protein